MIQELRSVGLCFGKEVGVDDVLLQVRIVEKKREGNTIFCRALLDNEEYDGQPVCWDPDMGEEFIIEKGDLRISVYDIDYMSEPNESGYVSLANTLWTWFQIVHTASPEQVRYLMSAAKRLDVAVNQLNAFHKILGSDPKGFFDSRVKAFEAMGFAEAAIISLSRAVDMALNFNRLFGTSTTVPLSVNGISRKLRNMRDAFEHIEDRAMGKIRGVADMRALSIFNQDRVLTEKIISYDGREIDLDQELSKTVSELRVYLIELTNSVSPISRTINQELRWNNSIKVNESELGTFP